MNDLVGRLVLSLIAAALIAMTLLVFAITIDVLGAALGLWHAPCALVNHQPQCKGWR